MATDEAEKILDILGKDLPQLGVKMQQFSRSMRSLYAENSVSSSVENGPEFIRLRDETRDDALEYLNCVMPVNEVCVRQLQEYFEQYASLSFPTWKASVEDILEDVAAFRETCTTLVKIHQAQMATLKQREDTANVLCKKFENLEKVYDEKSDELRRNAASKMYVAQGVADIPYVGLLVSPFLAGSACIDMSRAVAERDQQRIMVAAGDAVRDHLIPALKNFIDGLETISSFFNIMYNELESFKNMERKQLRHYEMLKAKANEIKGGCRAFYGMLPAVRSDFKAIPTEGTDFNYVDGWLDRQKQLIDDNCKRELSRNMIYKAMNIMVKSEKSLEPPANPAP